MQLIEFDRCDEVALARISRVPQAVYSKDPVWAAASETVFASHWAAADPSTHTLYRPILIEDAGQPLARAVAILKRGALDNDGAPQGYVGFFDCVKSRPDVAKALLSHCEMLLGQAGAKSVQAPKADNQLFGCQVTRFDLPHVCLTPHNPSYYAGYFEAAGYSVVLDIHSLYFTRETAGEQISFTMPGFTTREFDRSRLEEEQENFHNLQPQIFGGRPGYVPRTEAEDRAMIEELLPHMDDEMVIIAEDEGNNPVGVLVCLPDFYQAIAGVTPDRVRVVSIGILPGYVNKGIGTLMGVHLMRNLLRKTQYVFAEASLVLAHNIAPQNLAHRFRAVPGRKFVVLEKALCRVS